MIEELNKLVHATYMSSGEAFCASMKNFVFIETHYVSHCDRLNYKPVQILKFYIIFK